MTLQTFPGHVYHFRQLDSTQRFVREHPPSDLPVLCMADEQSAGVGQRGRVWQSPPGQFYMSFSWHLHGEPALHQGIAQMIALTLAQTLDPDAKTLRLKWPNDLFIADRKCGGILIESERRGEHTRLVIGIGINLTRSENHSPDQACLNEHFPARTPYSLLQSLLPALCTALQHWADKPYLPLDHRWHAYDRFYRQNASLENRSGSHTLHGIDQKGRLIAKDADGKLHFLTQTRILWPTS